MKTIFAFALFLFCLTSRAQTASGPLHCIDLTDPNLKQSSMGFPGNSGGTLEGQAHKAEAMVPLRIVVLAINAAGDRELIVTVQFTNIGAHQMLIPRSIDQRGVHEGTSGRYTAELSVRQVGGGVADDITGNVDARAIMFGASTDPASIYRLQPREDICLKVRMYSEQPLKGIDHQRFGVQYSLNELKDGPYVIDESFSPKASENAVGISLPLSKQ